jgi:hypothetical protein
MTSIQHEIDSAKCQNDNVSRILNLCLARAYPKNTTTKVHLCGCDENSSTDDKQAIACGILSSSV